MELNLELAFDQPVDLSHLFEIPAGRLDRPELVALAPVRFTGRLERAEPGFVLRGQVEIDAVVACARCLADVPFKGKKPVEWVFEPAHERAAAAARQIDAELAKEELDVIWYDEYELTFDPLIEEQLQLELPMKPLCREGCRGLCPACGADRNVTECSCAAASDSRWDALRSLKPSR